jgi:hypothetical protein
MKKLALAGSILTLGACAHVDTGQIDYRVADRPGTVQHQCPRGTGSLCVLAPTRVDRRYLSAPDPVREFINGDHISIELEQGVIGSNILEGEVLGARLGRAGEFAVLVNVFEFDSLVGIENDRQIRRFMETGIGGTATQDPSDVELKLVYFGQDVRLRQPFNFSKVPLLPLTRYRGGSIGIQIVIIEVDAGKGPISSMLGTLARFSEQILPGASEEADFVFDLGESLLSGSGGDDRLFEYRFVLSPPNPRSDVPQATLTAGRYVLRRSQQRDTPIDWENVRLDHNTARLFRYANDVPVEEIRDELYLVLNIVNHGNAERFQPYRQYGWQEIAPRIEQAVAAGADATTIGRVVETEMAARRSADRLASLSAGWEAVHLKMTRLKAVSAGTPAAAEADREACLVRLRDIQLQQDIAKRELRLAVRFFNVAYAAAMAGTTPELQPLHQESLIAIVAQSFEPYEPRELAASFATPAAFHAAYGGAGGAAALEQLVLKTAAPAQVTCDAPVEPSPEQ